MDLLEGTTDKVTTKELRIEGRENKTEEKEKEEEDITREELIKHLKMLKKEKALEQNNIKNEAWRLMPKEIAEVFFKLINKI